MEGVGPRLGDHALVGLDTSVFIYRFENSPAYSQIAADVLRQVSAARTAGVTSAITLMEMAVQPIRLGEEKRADSYRLLLRTFPNLTVVDIDIDVALRAAQLRAIYNLLPADALQVSACQRAGATAFVTNDKSLRRVNEIQVIILDDYIR